MVLTEAIIVIPRTRTRRTVHFDPECVAFGSVSSARVVRRLVETQHLPRRCKPCGNRQCVAALTTLENKEENDSKSENKDPNRESKSEKSTAVENEDVLEELQSSVQMFRITAPPSSDH